jgi:type IX secretion system PorP/SprF family membrane protein
MKKVLLSVLALAGISMGSWAQDVHFTQFFTSPLTLNPAQTGLTQNDWRASANIRQQWYTVSDNPYISGTVAFDMPLLRGKLPEGDALGIGVLGLYDKSGTGGLQNTTVGLSLAYHKSFGAEKQHTLSLGVQGYMVQKSINFEKLVFGDQFDVNAPEGYLNSVSKEQNNFTNTDLTYPDFNVGAMYSGRVAENATLYGGVSFYHLTRPEEKFLTTGTSVKINSRYTFNLGGSFNMNENTVLYLSAMYQKQGPASEFLMGGAVGFVMNPGHDEYTRNTVFYLGGWYRYGDAIAPYIGFEWSRMKFGISYDVTMSSAQTMTSGQGAWEFSVIYNGIIEKVAHKKYNFACPKF